MNFDYIKRGDKGGRKFAKFLHEKDIHAVWFTRVWSTRVKFCPVLNAYVVMTSSLLHKKTEI